MQSSGLALLFVAGRYSGGELPLIYGQDVIAGRDPSAELQLDEDGVSRMHARFYPGKGTLELRDMNSTNGTYVNGSRVQQAHLRVGDRVLIGRSIMMVIEDRGWMG